MTDLIKEPFVCVADVKATLGEGPIFDPRDGLFYWLDIKGGEIHRLNIQSNERETFQAPAVISSLALAQSGGFICAHKEGFGRLAFDNGGPTFTPFGDPESDLPDNRFNDGKADPAGGYWAGTMDDKERGLKSGSWWRLAPDGAMSRLVDGFHICNGPTFDVDRGRVYLTDSLTQKVFVAETDGTSLGPLTEFLSFAAEDGHPDGMEVDAEGCLWIAFWDGAAVQRFSPDGAPLERIPVPAKRPTSLNFVDDAIYVTSAAVGASERALEKWPQSGGLFKAVLSRSLATPVQYVDDASLPR